MSRRATSPLRLMPTQPGGGECATAAASTPNELCEMVLDEASISRLAAFFKLLDEWDKEAEPK